MRITVNNLRKIIREAISQEASQQDEFVEKINALILADDGDAWNNPSYDQAMEFLRAMPELLEHPDLRIYGAYDEYEGEIMRLNRLSDLTKEEAMSFTEYGGEPVELISTEWVSTDDDSLSRYFEYRHI